MVSKVDNNRTSVLRSIRRWLWLPATIIILVLALLVGLPYGMSWALKGWLLDNGAGQVDIHDIDFNPFTGIASVKLLNVRVGDLDTLVIPNLTLDLDWSPLFSRKVYVKAITVDGVNLVVEQSADGDVTVGGIQLQEDGPDEPAGEPWGYGIITLDIKNTVIEYRTPDLELKVRIDDLALSELATWADAPAVLSFQGALNGAALVLEGELPPLSEGYGYTGNIQLSALPLAAFEAMAQPALTGLAGGLTLDTRIAIEKLHDKPVQVQQEGQLGLDDLQLAQGGNSVTNKQLHWKGTTDLVLAESVTLKTRGVLTGDGLAVDMPENSLSNQQLQWEGTTDLTLADSVTIKTRGVITGDGLTVDMPAQGINLQQGKLAWDGSVDYTGAETGGLQAAGKIQLSGLPKVSFEANTEQALTGQAGALTLDTRIALEKLHDEPVQVQQEGQLRLDDLQLAQAGNSVTNKQLQWKGTTDLVLAESVTIKTRGALTSDGLAVEIPAEGVNLQQGKLAWDGSIDYTGAESGGLQITGKLDLEQTRLDPRDADLRLVSFDRLAIESILVHGVESITIENLAITDAVFAQTLTGTDATEDEEPPPLQIASLDFDRIEVTDGKRVSIDTILSDHANYVARRNKGGEWRMATIMGSLPFPHDEDKTTTAGQDVSEGEPGSIRIGVLENTNATLTLEDYSVTPEFRMTFDMQEVTKDIDSAKPDQDTHVYLEGSIGKHNKVEIRGTVRPFATPLALNLEGNIEGLELPPLSPYAIDSIGHRLESGELDAVSTLKLVNGQLDGQNQLTMRSLQLSPVKGEQLDKMQGQLAVPLDKALDMLRDDHDVIQLQLPITGDLDNPDFDASDAINQAVAKATKEGAITSLTLLLQPYGSLITVARYAADMASAIKLDPVIFSPASAEIDAARHDYLDKVAGIIAQRPNINVKLCGVATAADRTALQERALAASAEREKKKSEQQLPPIGDEQLVDIADQRDAAIKDYLISRHGIKPGRLVACQPAIDAEKDAEPRVDLLI